LDIFFELYGEIKYTQPKGGLFSRVDPESDVPLKGVVLELQDPSLRVIDTVMLASNAFQL
jgi:hypothetical protein